MDLSLKWVLIVTNVHCVQSLLSKFFLRQEFLSCCTLSLIVAFNLYSEYFKYAIILSLAYSNRHGIYRLKLNIALCNCGGFQKVHGDQDICSVIPNRVWYFDLNVNGYHLRKNVNCINRWWPIAQYGIIIGGKFYMHRSYYFYSTTCELSPERH